VPLGHPEANQVKRWEMVVRREDSMTIGINKAFDDLFDRCDRSKCPAVKSFLNFSARPLALSKIWDYLLFLKEK
jgi:hypothetical protein